MPSFLRRCTAVLAFAALLGLTSAGAQPGPVSRDAGASKRTVLIPSADRRARMQVTIVRPPGAGPFPLVVINHGSTQSPEGRAAMGHTQYETLTQWFVRRGYVVALPQRLGHGRTGGPYLEDQRGCDNADYRAAGLGAADSIEIALAYMTAQSYVRKTGIVLVGQSAGAWGALALASRNPRGVVAAINFAGGRGGRSFERPNKNCAPDRLVATARQFGSTARARTLWIYTQNDSYFPPALSRRMADAFRDAGGIVEYRLLPKFGAEGHRLAESREGVAIWGPVIEEFLARLK